MGQTTTSATETFPRASEMTSQDAHQGIDRISGTAHQAVDRVASAAQSAAGRVGEVREQFMNAKDEWYDTARDYVREHPMAALGIAVAAGFLLSRLTER